MNSKRKIIPLGARVLVAFEEDTHKTKSGIYIPETVNKDRPEQGKVLAVGEGRTTDDGKVIPMNVKVGEKVMFAKYGPDEIKIAGKEYFILSESNILAVLE